MSIQTRVIGILIIGLMVMGLGYERVVNASTSEIYPATMDARAVAEAVEAAVRSGETGVSENSVLKPESSDGDDGLLEVPAPPGYFDDLNASLADTDRRPALRNASMRDAVNGIGPDSVLSIILDEPAFPYYAGSESVTTVEAELESEPLVLGEQTIVSGPSGGPEQGLRTASLDGESLAGDADTFAVEETPTVSTPDIEVADPEPEVAEPRPGQDIVLSPDEERANAPSAEVQAASVGEAMTLTERMAAFEEQLTFSFNTFEDREIERRADPRIPATCRDDAGDAEIVIVRFRVTSNGRAYRPTIAATTNECLNNAALSAARKARFDVQRLRRRTDRSDNFILTYAFENTSS